MSESRQPGWYEDPNDSKLMRYWDGNSWTSMTRPQSESGDSPTNNAVTEPNADLEKAARTIIVVTDAFIKLSISIGVLFIFSIIPMTFTPLGQYTIGGTSLISIASMVSAASVIMALIAGGIAMPAQLLAKKAGFHVAAFETSREAEMAYADDQFSDEDRKIAVDCAIFFRSVMNTRNNCAAVSYVIGSVAAIVLHDVMMSMSGQPWTDLLTLILIAVLSAVVASMLTSVFMKKYEKENPVLYQEVMEAVSSR